MTKSDLRLRYTEKRQTLSQDEVLSLSEKIFENFLVQFKPVPSQKIHCFLPITEKKEINTRSFIKYFFDHQIRIFVPKVSHGKLISVEISRDTSFIKSFWNILEPASNIDSAQKDFDFVITPLLYCDDEGNRVGYGKGFYDEFFGSISSKALKIGVSLFQPVEKVDDAAANDVRLDYLVTPTEVLSFRG